jgi:hypothetical protein
MLKRLSLMMMIGICGVLMTTAVFAEEQKEHCPIGERAKSQQERIAQLETRAGLSEKHPEENKKEQLLKTRKSLFHTSHPGAYQNPVSISFYGDNIELTDGSVWIVSHSDSHKTLNWYTTDLLIITPNHSIFSSHAYRITNQTTGQSVAVNLSLGPIAPPYGSSYTHWIVGIDYYYNVIYLEDGSRWNMSSFDHGIVNQWVIGDVVIIGVNDGWLSFSNPNILINVATLDFAAGNVTF